MIFCALSMLDLEPDHLAGAQAAAIAETEQQLATLFEQLASDRPDRADSLLAQAQRAREFAEHELAEQQRWREVTADET